MTDAIPFDPDTEVINLDRSLKALKVPAMHDPGIPVDGVTFGVAMMTENSPHGGERHNDGDEILYLVSGHIRIVFVDSDADDIDVQPGDGLVVPKATWHRVDILEPSRIVYVTPGPNNDYKPLS